MAMATSGSGRIGLPRSRLRGPGSIAVASFISYIIGQLADGPVSTAFLAFGVSACGWAWLLARGLFVPVKQERAWPGLVVLAVMIAGALMVTLPAGGWVQRVAEGVYAITGSAALLLTFVEPFQGWQQGLSGQERRFRLVFVGLYASLVAIAVLGLRAVDDGAWATSLVPHVRAACAAVGLVGALAAFAYRRRHPLVTASAPKRQPTDDDLRLAERLERLMATEELYTRPDLKVGDVASRLVEAEYRVSQAIGALGHANFNRWINQLRICQAQRILADPADTRAILQIAYDCGFSSLGPFNRAFRDQLGTTPRAYRAACQRGA